MDEQQKQEILELLTQLQREVYKKLPNSTPRLNRLISDFITELRKD